MRSPRKIRQRKKQNKTQKKIRTSISISQEIWEELKIKSIKQRKTIGEIIEEIIRKQKRRPKKEDIVVI
jgi:macrodomain Ter protein organizer (MatP/YcbG family)